MRDVCPLPSQPAISFLFKARATTEIYTLSLHDALPISALHAELGQEYRQLRRQRARPGGEIERARQAPDHADRHVVAFGWPVEGSGGVRVAVVGESRRGQRAAGARFAVVRIQAQRSAQEGQ